MFRPIGHIRGIVHQHQQSDRTPRRDVHTTKALQQPIYTQTERTTPLLKTLARSITARIGFTDRFERIIAPMLNAKTVGDMKLYFQSLNKVVQLARERPKVAYKILRKAAQSPKSLYAGLTLLASGDRGALEPTLNAIAHLKGNYSLALDGIRRLAVYDPQSAHALLKKLFGNKALTAPVRLNLFREVMMSKGFGKDVLPSTFEHLMTDTTPKDRNRLIYPSILKLMEKWKPHHPQLRVNHEVTKEMLRGWIASCEIITDANHAHAQQVLGISPSTRG